MPALDQPPPIICSIVQEQIGNRLQLHGRAIGRQETQGNFSLRVIKIGQSGSSSTAQSGTFSTQANAETLVGMASFNMEPEAHLRRTSASGSRGKHIVAGCATKTRDEDHMAAPGAGRPSKFRG
jgi:hypothetical protein